MASKARAESVTLIVDEPSFTFDRDTSLVRWDIAVDGGTEHNAMHIKAFSKCVRTAMRLIEQIEGQGRVVRLRGH